MSLLGLSPVSVVKTKILAGIGIAGLLAVIGLLVWGSLEHNWRVKAEDRLNSIRITIDTAMGNAKPTSDRDLPSGVKDLAADRNLALSERDQARGVVDLQTASIDRLEQETELAARKSAADQKLIQATLRERDRLIARAKQAETRLDRLTAEQELEECEAVLDSLYRDGL